MFSLRRIRQVFVPLKDNLFPGSGIYSARGPQKLTNLVSLKNPEWKTVRHLSAQAPNTKVFEGQEYSVSKIDENAITRGTISLVNEQVAKGNEGRLFAVVHVCGKQFKITAEDIIIVEGYWPPQNGDELKLEKVLLVGGKDFTLVGRPILPQDLITVKATVIEKDLSHTKTVFYKKRRKQYMRINSILCGGNLSDPSEKEQSDKLKKQIK